jgi:hypothetical protein
VRARTAVAATQMCRSVKRSVTGADAPAMVTPPAQRRHSWVGRLFRLVVVGIAGVALGVGLYAGLIKVGLLSNPFAAAISGDIELARSHRAGLRVLFIGNSLTAENSMPALVHDLAATDEGARPIFAVQYTGPSWTLRRASDDDRLTALLEDVGWDVVVLQEQSRIASFAAYRPEEMYPFARALDRKIASAGARTMLFMTWGYEDGAPIDVPGENFEAMQARLAQGYSDLATELSATVAPVGLAWAEARRRAPEIHLWTTDGKHPSLLGSYLAACVFYAMLTGRDPAGSRFTAGLERAEVRFLQDVAVRVVGPYLQVIVLEP